MSKSADRPVRHVRLVTRAGVHVTPSELRAHPRYRTFLAAKIRVKDGPDILCVVRDMSKSGARLVIDPAAQVPCDIELHVLTRSEVFQGQVVWRERDLVGMKFTAWSRL